MSLLAIAVYVIALVFITAILTRAIKIARMPEHVRWELYPVPHEKGRAHYGGSILEEVDWWTKPRKKDHLNEALTMASEILLLKGVWEHNRKLWFGSFPLHFGLYLLIGMMFLAIAQTLLGFAGVTIPFIKPAIHYLMTVGCWLGGIGAIVMLFLRMFDEGLSRFATGSHYFNLIVLGAINFTGLWWMYTDGAFSETLLGLYNSLFTLSAVPELSAAAYWNLGVTLFFVLYLPFTHMTHFFTKYFTYHDIRWNDAANLPGDDGIQNRVNEQLKMPVNWSAPHIGADGKKNWAEITTSPVPKADDKEKK